MDDIIFRNYSDGVTVFFFLSLMQRKPWDMDVNRHELYT